MSKYNDTLLTNEGTRLATLAANGKTHYVITRAVTTGDDLSGLTEEELRALMALPNEVQDGSIVGKQDDPSGSDGIMGTQVQFMNQGLSKSYSINAIGLYAKEDGQENETLFAVMTAEKEHAQYMPDFADKVVLRFGITIFVIVGDKANVTVQFDPDGLASIKFVEDAIAAIPKPDMSQYYTKTQVDGLVKPLATSASVANGDSSTLASAKGYADSGDKTTLSSAKSYTDGKLAGYYTKAEVDAAIQKAVQSTLNQAHTDMLAEWTKRNAPSSWITNLTESQYNALATKDSTAEYDLPE